LNQAVLKLGTFLFRVQSDYEVMGWLGSIFLVIRGIPELYIAYTSNTCSITYAFLILWALGELFSCMYTIKKVDKRNIVPLMFKYIFNFITAIVLFSYKFLGN